MNDTHSVNMTRRGLLLGGVAMLALAGCANLIGPGPAPQLYVLRPMMPSGGSLPAVTWQLSVALPGAAASLDTTRIALSRSATTMDYFASSVWPDRAPFLLQGAMVEAFESTGKIVAVQRDVSGIGANYLLQTELRAFEARYDAASLPAGKDDKDAASPPPKVMVSLECKLLIVPEHRILQSRTITKEALAERNDMDSIVQAFNAAVAAVLADLTDWTLRAPAVG